MESIPDLEEARCIISSLVDRMIQSAPNEFELVCIINYVANYRGYSRIFQATIPLTMM